MKEDIMSIHALRKYLKEDLRANDSKARTCGYKYLK